MSPAEMSDLVPPEIAWDRDRARLWAENAKLRAAPEKILTYCDIDNTDDPFVQIARRALEETNGIK